ncbi:glycerophosphodiester phosphodiesterase family protein [Corynebacterium pseudodiphtheriticum]|uniref:glycerophosphodiester phosphodiesterase family protein n=1 Tax=Corynebacterium pseudodiphtheriticum TaxID=37637 RepID=UPI00234C83D1|nr:glycerophosphodiester phosphodiesterase family protein [Corynebacterium pseudodiphtheriticum]MDC7113535.1 glycerophosphodiester phosphodiesterase family protein [Corynebacterium pseudodiphtheriticum]
MLTGCNIVAHRGYSGKYPENSPEAFQQALQLPIHGLECDIRASRDGQAVVIHDPSVDRTSTGTGMVARMTWPELQRLNIGTEDTPQKLMLVDDLLRMLGNNPHHLYIETKPLVRQGAALEKALARALHRTGMVADPRVHIISFSHASLRRLASLVPQVDRIYLRRGWERRWNSRDLMLSRPHALGLSLDHGKANPAAIGVGDRRTYMWTVDDPDDMRWARDNGVNILATNWPELALEVVGDQ